MSLLTRILLWLWLDRAVIFMDEDGAALFTEVNPGVVTHD